MTAILLGTGWEESEIGLPLTVSGQKHILTLGEPGTGKSRSVGMPNLILQDCPMIISDISGEHVKNTAHWRAQMLGHEVRVLDSVGFIDDRDIPPGTDGTVQRACLNPIDFIRNSVSPELTTFNVCDSLIPITGSNEAHWPDGAQGRVGGVTLFVAFDPVIDELHKLDPRYGRNMSTVWRFLSNPHDEKQSLEMMADSDNDFVADQASAVLNAAKDNREMQSIRNQIRVNLSKMFSIPGVLKSMDSTNIDFKSLVRDKVSIYNCIPGSMAPILFRLLRLYFALAFAEIEAAGVPDFNPDRPQIVALFDEVAALKNFPPILYAMAFMRKYGLRLHLMAQNLGQLNSEWGKDFDSLMGNVGCIQHFGGTNSKFQADYLSALCGVQTIVTTTVGQPQRAGDFGSVSEATTGRPIIMPDEIMRLPMPQQLIKISGQNVAYGRVLNPDLSDFPQYLAFMECLKAGYSPEVAKDAAHRFIPQEQPPMMIVPAKRAPRQRQQQKDRNGSFDSMLSKFMGHDQL